MYKIQVTTITVDGVYLRFIIDEPKVFFKSILNDIKRRQTEWLKGDFPEECPKIGYSISNIKLNKKTKRLEAVTLRELVEGGLCE